MQREEWRGGKDRGREKGGVGKKLVAILKEEKEETERQKREVQKADGMVVPRWLTFQIATW